MISRLRPILRPVIRIGKPKYMLGGRVASVRASGRDLDAFVSRERRLTLR